MAKKVALINMKGGVGKSTLAVNLAWDFAADQRWLKRALVVDLDPQFNASQYLLGEHAYRGTVLEPNTPTVWDILEQYTYTPQAAPVRVDPDGAILNVRSYRGGGQVDLLASRLELAWSLRQPAEKEQLLARFLANVEDRYHVIIIDCAPTESLLTTAAYLAADYILVPVKPEYLSTIGLPLLERSLREFRGRYPDKAVQIAGVVFNHATEYRPEEALSKSEVGGIARDLGWYVFSAEVKYSRSYPKGAREGKPIWGTSHARWTRISEFDALAAEVARRISL